jgi:spore germination cell wall hydrolase CwlJ-like protein
MAGGLAHSVALHAKTERLADAAASGFSETALIEQAGMADPAALMVARRHDPAYVSDSVDRDRQAALFAMRLERRSGADRLADTRIDASHLLMRASYSSDFPIRVPALRAGSFNALSNSRELDCLTQAVYYEARGETPSGQAAVAQVVLNRVRHPAFPKTICAVVFQGAYSGGTCQFSFACDGSIRRVRDQGAWRRAERVASRALDGAVVSQVGKATHFHTTSVAPEWGQRLMRVAQVGLHVFYRFSGSPMGAPGLGGQGPGSPGLGRSSLPVDGPVLTATTPDTGAQAVYASILPQAIQMDVSHKAATAPDAVLVQAEAPNRLAPAKTAPGKAAPVKSAPAKPASGQDAGKTGMTETSELMVKTTGSPPSSAS